MRNCLPIIVFNFLLLFGSSLAERFQQLRRGRDLFFYGDENATIPADNQTVAQVAVDTCIDSIAVEDNNCFNLTVFGWGEGLGPWDTWAGFVCVEMPQSEQLTVLYQPASYWKLWEANLWVGDNLNEIPTAWDGTATIEEFPYQSGNLYAAHSHAYNVSLDSVWSCFNTTSYSLYIAAYAFVAEPFGPHRPGEYIRFTEYPAWGNNVDDPTLDREAEEGFLHIEVPINCQCSTKD